MKYLIILNPGSKGGKSRKKWNKISKILNSKNIIYDLKITQTLDDATQFSREGNVKNIDIIIAIGGDGTINRVINGFFKSDGRRFSKTKLAVIYTGTSPDFCKSYNIPLKINEAIDTILKNKSVSIDIGKIIFSKNYNINNNFSIAQLEKDQNFQSHYFSCCTNVGLGATLARFSNGGIRKILGDFFGTFISLIRTLFAYKANTFTLLLDGELQKLNKLYNISIGKTYYIASGIKVNHNLKFNDNRFYILIVKNLSLLNVFSVLKKIYSGKKLKNTHSVSLTYAKEIEVLTNNENPEIELDGDPIGFLPCKIEIVKDKLDVLTNE